MEMTKILIRYMEEEELLYNKNHVNHTDRAEGLAAQNMVIKGLLQAAFPTFATLLTPKAIMEKWGTLKSAFKKEPRKVGTVYLLGLRGLLQWGLTMVGHSSPTQAKPLGLTCLKGNGFFTHFILFYRLSRPRSALSTSKLVIIWRGIKLNCWR